MPDTRPDPRLLSIYQRAQVCRTFPAYRLDELRDSPEARDLLTAMELLNLERQLHS